MSRSAVQRLPLEPLLLAAVLLAAVAARVTGLFSGIPFAVGVDEPAVVERALNILRTGDWNTHSFDYPSLVIYFHAVVAALRFLWGAAEGQWSNLAVMDASALYGWARVAAAAIGVATVWMTYRLGCRLESSWVGLVAAAQLALMPLHVRESHFALTDVPATLLVTVTLLLTVRAARERTPIAYAWAGAAAGLAAAAKYNALVVLLPVYLAWAIDQTHLSWRGRRGAAPALILGGFVAAFLVVTPYSVLDITAFLNGFGAQLARFAPGARTLPEPAGILYIKHLNLAAAGWLPLAAIGAVFALWRTRGRRDWTPVVGFVAVYAWVLAAHPLVFARYALPLVPALCLLAAVPICRLGDSVLRRTANRRAASAVAVLATLIVMIPFGAATADWVQQLMRPDTRTIAAERMRAVLPPGSVVAVELHGPTNLQQAGFEVVATASLLDHDLSWYRAARVAYLVASARDLTPYRHLLRGAPVVQVSPVNGQWGQPILVFPLEPD